MLWKWVLGNLRIPFEFFSVLLLITAFLAGYTINLLLITSKHSGEKSFEGLAVRSYGRPGKILTSIMIVFHCLGGGFRIEPAIVVCSSFPCLGPSRWNPSVYSHHLEMEVVNSLNAPEVFYAMVSNSSGFWRTWITLVFASKLFPEDSRYKNYTLISRYQECSCSKQNVVPIW